MFEILVFLLDVESDDDQPLATFRVIAQPDQPLPPAVVATVQDIIDLTDHEINEVNDLNITGMYVDSPSITGNNFH